MNKQTQIAFIQLFYVFILFLSDTIYSIFYTLNKNKIQYIVEFLFMILYDNS